MTATGDAKPIEDVKRALLRDIDAGRVCQDGDDLVCLMFPAEGDEPASAADVTSGAWGLYGDGLAEPADTASGLRYWRLTRAGLAYLEAVPS